MVSTLRFLDACRRCRLDSAFGLPLAFHSDFPLSLFLSAALWGFIVCLITQITEQIIMVKHETVIVIVMASHTQQLL